MATGFKQAGTSEARHTAAGPVSAKRPLRQRTRWLVAGSGLVAGVAMAACFGTSESQCLDSQECGPGTGASGTGGSGAQGGGGTGGGIPAGCIPSELAPSEAPADDCGVFVSSSQGNDTNGTGSKATPYATIGHAVQAGAHVIYACTDGFNEAVTLPAGTRLYGGLDCTHAWHYVGAQTNTPLTAPADSVPLTLAAGSGTTHVEDMDVTAAPAVAVGGSSIAVIANGVTAEIVGSGITAGDGKAGQSSQSQGPDAGLDGNDGAAGSWQAQGVCNQAAAQYDGGAGGPKTCADSTVVSGGNGGNGTNGTTGDVGQEGQPPTADTTGDGGPGQPSGAGSCGQGQQGANGTVGPSGLGATAIGTLDGTGYHGADGTAGQTGVHGQGGGGGGGGHECQANSNFAGPSGGGGGSGGCGGAGGGAGKAGGSSIALVSVSASVTLTACTVTTAAGGSGGDGVPGQAGGIGAFNTADPGGAGACAGGMGGSGGPGGPGGGGHGGHSVGIAFDGGTAPVTTDTTFSVGAFGPGGAGGTTPDLDGDAGLPCQTLDFAQGAASCVSP